MNFVSSSTVCMPGRTYADTVFSKTEDLRIFGQACFLAFSVFLGGTIVYTIVEQKRQGDFKGSRSAHPTLLLLLVAWVFLLARGIWGMLQASVNDLSVRCIHLSVRLSKAYS